MADVLKLTTIAGTELFRVDDSGNVTAAGTISTTGTDDFGASGIKADVIAESTSAAGVTIDGLLLKDKGIDASALLTGEFYAKMPANKADALSIYDPVGDIAVLATTAGSRSLTFTSTPITTNSTITATGLINGSTLDQNAIIDQDTADTAGTGAAYDSLGTSTSATGSYAIIKGTFQQLTNAKTAGVGFGVQGTYVGLAGDTSGAIVGGLYAAAPTLNGGSATDCGLAIAAGYTNDIYFVDTSAVITVQDGQATALTLKDSGGNNFLVVDTVAVDGMTFGNATTNPVYQFLGTGAATFGGTLTATGGITGTALAADESVVATVACADAGGGATTALLSVTLKQRDNSTAITSARQVVLCASSTQYLLDAGPGNASLSLGTVTAGSIVATPVAGGLWLVETDATGVFACTATNTDDETVYFSAQTAQGGVSDVTKRCLVLGSNSDSAAWSA